MIGSSPLIDTVNKISDDSVKMAIFSKIKTGNVVFDTVISTIILTLMSYFVKLMYMSSLESNFKLTEIDFTEDFKNIFYKKNKIIMSGKKCSTVNYFCAPVVSSVFGDRFKAVWEKIITDIENNSTIFEIKDFMTLTTNNSNNNDEKKKSNDIYIVSQKKSFLFNKELKMYASTCISSEESSNDKEKGTNSKIDNIEITLYSYETSLSDMKKYIDKITEEYLENIEKTRNNKQFIYTLNKTKFEDSKFECWKESCFDSTRCFENMFFEQKNDVIEKLDFFLKKS
jgi:hypothetical protein